MDGTYLWERWVEQQQFMKNKIKPSIDELLLVIDKYKRQNILLKNQRKSV